MSSVSGQAVVYSHGVGGGAKNASSLFQFMLANRLLEFNCQSILFIAADCMDAGRNLMTTVSGPAYFVQNGLAVCVVMLFMEKMSSKCLADHFFGRFTRLVVPSCPFAFYAEVSSDPARIVLTIQMGATFLRLPCSSPSRLEPSFAPSQLCVGLHLGCCLHNGIREGACPVLSHM